MGTLAGIASFMLFLILYYIGISPLGIAKIIGIPVPIILLVLLGLRTRKLIPAEELSKMLVFKQLLLKGFVLIMVWCSFKSFCIYIFITIFEPDVITQYIEFTKNYVAFLDRFTPEDLTKVIDMEAIERDATPGTLAAADAVNNTIFGGIINFLIAAIFALTTKTSPLR